MSLFTLKNVIRDLIFFQVSMSIYIDIFLYFINIRDIKNIPENSYTQFKLKIVSNLKNLESIELAK